MDDVLAIIREDAGTAFDPRVVQALEALAAAGMLHDFVGE
jgi:HD-GYP domain-containing protein (c-di-GMP phosphodiesterase class II)